MLTRIWLNIITAIHQQLPLQLEDTKCVHEYKFVIIFQRFWNSSSNKKPCVPWDTINGICARNLLVSVGNRCSGSFWYMSHHPNAFMNASIYWFQQNNLISTENVFRRIHFHLLVPRTTHTMFWQNTWCIKKSLFFFSFFSFNDRSKQLSTL